VLGICGDRAKLLQKYGINEISDELLENNVTVRVGRARRRRPAAAARQVPRPRRSRPLLAQMDPDFQSGKKQIDGEAVMEEVFGAAGYRDGGKRFIKEGQPKPEPDAAAGDRQAQSEAEKKAQAKKAVLDALSNAAKVGIAAARPGTRQGRHLFDLHHDHVEQVGRAQDMGHQHGKDIADRQNAAAGLEPRRLADAAAGLARVRRARLRSVMAADGGGAPAAGFAGGGESPPPDIQALPPPAKRHRRRRSRRGREEAHGAITPARRRRPRLRIFSHRPLRRDHVKIMITNGGPHPADKWAELTTDTVLGLVQIAEDSVSDEAAAARAAKRACAPRCSTSSTPTTSACRSTSAVS
jgi:hypothetical protein